MAEIIVERLVEENLERRLRILISTWVLNLNPFVYVEPPHALCYLVKQQ